MFGGMDIMLMMFGQYSGIKNTVPYANRNIIIPIIKYIAKFFVLIGLLLIVKNTAIALIAMKLVTDVILLILIILNEQYGF